MADQIPENGKVPENGKASKPKIVCSLTGKEYSRGAVVSIATVMPSLVERIRKDYPDLKDDAFVSRKELDRYRTLYVTELLRDESGDVSEIEKQVAESLATHETLAENVEEEFSAKRSVGEILSDGLAQFGGSWTFLIVFAAFLGIWMLYNSYRAGAAFDPYPYILLNLILSTIAAVQAPIIMMSQRRQEEKDRLRSLNDYRVNLKAELEIRHLHEKIDHLINKQWQRLAEIQSLQLDKLAERRK
ncbi:MULTISPECIES: DUF1003 domain-containing protein [unclassified Hyphomicrobium]|jgi:uncharacterized membrane protein|uniref:DUF1003 domain-containing protein n=1 Tax=unclassified Hyphomicrobium TaxID=2619925 RepID=UPI000213E8D2|nr:MULTISPECIES: DUF1003 domain-containing protein [unclassified Hyphomicrobium]CCB65349.1 conserved protein of unknown function [Hyphomicrobium sp. MC1]